MSVSSASNLLTKSQIIAVLSENYADLAEEFPIASLELFGSYARDEQTPQSDVDLLVTFSRPMGFGFMHLADASIFSPQTVSSPIAATPSLPR